MYLCILVLSIAYCTYYGSATEILKGTRGRPVSQQHCTILFSLLINFYFGALISFEPREPFMTSTFDYAIGLSTSQTNLKNQHCFEGLTSENGFNFWLSAMQEHEDTPTASLLNLGPAESILEVRCLFLFTSTEQLTDRYLTEWSLSAEMVITAVLLCRSAQRHRGGSGPRCLISTMKRRSRTSPSDSLKRFSPGTLSITPAAARSGSCWSGCIDSTGKMNRTGNPVSFIRLFLTKQFTLCLMFHVIKMNLSFFYCSGKREHNCR